MAYAQTDEFVQICIEHDYNVKDICSALHALYPTQDVRPYKVEQRIANCKRRGLLPLASGNSVDTGQILRGTSTLKLGALTSNSYRIIPLIAGNSL